jgi:hypothetical protein
MVADLCHTYQRRLWIVLDVQRALLRQRIRQGLRRAAAEGRFPGRRQKVTDDQIYRVLHLPVAVAAREVGLSVSQFMYRRGVLLDAKENSL